MPISILVPRIAIMHNSICYFYGDTPSTTNTRRTQHIRWKWKHSNVENMRQLYTRRWNRARNATTIQTEMKSCTEYQNNIFCDGSNANNERKIYTWQKLNIQEYESINNLTQLNFKEKNDVKIWVFGSYAGFFFYLLLSISLPFFLSNECHCEGSQSSFSNNILHDR